jgi:hypothetical protein
MFKDVKAGRLRGKKMRTSMIQHKPTFWGFVGNEFSIPELHTVAGTPQ